MRSHSSLLRFAGGVAGLALVVAGASAQGRPGLAWNPTALETRLAPDSIRALGAASGARRAEVGYLFALPAFLHLRQRYDWTRSFTTYMGDRGNPFGQFLLLREPTSPATTDPQPNHDTLYGATFLDLSVGPVVLSVPAVPDRYYSIALLDAYFYNFEYVGSRTTGQQAGRFLIVGPGWQGETPAGIARVIRAPTNSIHMYQRIYFRDRADVAAVNALQDRMSVVPLARFLDPSAEAPLPDPARVLALDLGGVTDAARMFEVTNPYMAENPPPLEDRTLWEHVAPVGIGPGVTVPADPGSREVLRQGAELARETMSVLALDGTATKNGWQLPPGNVGRRGGAGGMAFHAMTQVRAIGINVPEEAVYYMAYTDRAGRPLTGSRRYVMRFAANELPPLRTDRFGFWSVTMYDRERLRLVQNPADRYSVRSGDPLHHDADGSLTLYVQPDPPRDPAQRANWLPSPPGADFVLNLRVYVGGRTVVDGGYVPPALEAVP
jgi:hypothetical protein